MPKELAKRSIASGFRQLVAQKPFSSITVNDICKHSGVSRRTFYRYFSDKCDVFSWIYYDEFLSKVEYHEDWVVWDYFPAACVYCYSVRELFVAAGQVKGENSTKHYWREFLRPLIMHDYQDYGISQEAANIYIDYACDVLFDIMCDWLSRPDAKPPLEFAADMRSIRAQQAKCAWETAAREPSPESIPEPVEPELQT